MNTLHYSCRATLGILVLILLSAAQAKASPKVDPSIHDLCIQAKDYVGCVRAMNGEASFPESSRTITSQGADVAEGNQCPTGYAYIGGGNCQDVRCEYGGASSLGHDQLIAGLKDKEGKDAWGCNRSFLYGAGVLRLSGAVVRTTNNLSCPPGEPRLGYNNTCQTSAKDWLPSGSSIK
jgi:hypothetical protein